MSNYYDNQTTIDNALRTICYLCEENSVLRSDLEGMKRVHDNALEIIGTRNDEIAELKKLIENLEEEIDLLSQDDEGYDPYDFEDECPSVSARQEVMSVSACPVMVDPPSGWKYGFPKVMPNFAAPDREKMNRWLFDNGYPLEEIVIWVPKDKWEVGASTEYILANADVPFRAWADSEDQS